MKRPITDLSREAVAIPRVRPVMQMLLRTAVASDDGRRFAMSAVLDWAARKWPGLVPQGAWQGEDFEHDRPGLEIGAVNLPDRGLWGFRVEHPDSEVAGRMWMVEAVVAAAEGGFDVVGVRSQCTVGREGDIPATSPAFVKVWTDRLGFEDAGQTAASVPIEVNNDGAVAALVSLIRNPERQLPVIVASQWTDGSYLIDPERLARRTAGLAHVARLPSAQADELSEELGRELSVFNGAVRTYRPGFGQANDTQMHVNALPARISAWPGADGNGPGAFLEFLVAQMHRFSVGTPARLDQMPSYVQLRRFRVEHERAQQIKRLEVLQKDLASRPNADLSSEVEVLKAKLEEKALDLEILTLEKDKAKEDAAEASQLFNEQAAELQAIREELTTLRATSANLVAGLARLKEAKGEADRLPTAYGEIAEWVDQNLSDRLFLHNRARRVLKDAVFQNVSLVVRCLLLLANEYWTLRNADPENFASAKLAFETRMQDLGIDEAPSISDTRRGEVEEQYTIHYTIGFKPKQILDRHLRGGSNSKNDHYCMRIYFLWDDEQQKVVVGHLPSHLDTRAT